KVAGTISRDHRLHKSLDLRLGGWERRFDRMEASNNALDIAIDYRRGAVEGDGRDGGTRIVANAGQFPQAFFRIREPAAEFFRYQIGAFLQVPGAGIVAEAGPGLHDVIHIGGGEVEDRWPSGRKCVKI